MNGSPLLVAASFSSSGKHTVSCALLRLLRRAGVDSAPLKPFAVERFPRAAARDITPSIQIQSIAAGVQPRPNMNPIRVLYPVRRGAPALYVNGRREPDIVGALADRRSIDRHITEAFADLSKTASVVIIEGTGGISDWIGSSLASTIIDALRARILLVADTFNGGALCSAIGTLEVLPRRWRSRVAGVIFNRFGAGAAAEPIPSWAAELNRRYKISKVGTIPTLTGIGSLCEDRWPIASQRKIDRDVDRVADALASALDIVQLIA